MKIMIVIITQTIQILIITNIILRTHNRQLIITHKEHTKTMNKQQTRSNMINIKNNNHNINNTTIIIIITNNIRRNIIIQHI